MKNYYKVNYQLLLLLLTPTLLRNAIQTAFLTSLSDSLNSINEDFNSFTQSLKTMASAQTCYMQAILNDNFDYYERRIIVRPAPIDFDFFLLWKENQDKPVMISKEGTEGAPYLLNRDGQIGANNNDFEIVFPYFFTFSNSELKRLRTLVNQNKLAPKKYTLLYEQDKFHCTGQLSFVIRHDGYGSAND